ncbi:MAG: response regulator [Myxococcales bacterium]|nr:response regulator [Myxococcales bacterium]
MSKQILVLATAAMLPIALHGAASAEPNYERNGATFGASFGFQAISDLGAGIELAARHRDASALRGLVDELDRFLKGRAAATPALATAIAPVAVATAVARAIVLIDDDDDLRELFVDVLMRRGHHVKSARSGLDGVALIIAERPDVAIIDISLPDIDGYEVARRARAAVAHEVHLVAMTGHGQESDRLAALAAGFDAHMTKPIDMALVEAMLQGDI